MISFFWTVIPTYLRFTTWFLFFTFWSSLNDNGLRIIFKNCISIRYCYEYLQLLPCFGIISKLMNLAEILCRFSLVYGRRCVYFQQTESVYLIWCSKMIWYYPTIGGITIGCLTLSWRGPLSYRNQSIELLCILMDWFLYDNGFCQERVNVVSKRSRLTHLLPLISYYTLTKISENQRFSSDFTLCKIRKSPETMRKLRLSTKFPHEEIRWNSSIFVRG